MARTAEAGVSSSQEYVRLTWKPFTLYPYTRGIIDKEVMRQVFHRAVLNIVGGQGTGLVFKKYFIIVGLVYIGVQVFPESWAQVIHVPQPPSE